MKAINYLKEFGVVIYIICYETKYPALIGMTGGLFIAYLIKHYNLQ